MEAPAPVFTWFGLILIACFIAGVLVAGGVLVAVVFATRPRKRPRPVVARPVREAPRPAPPLPAFQWPDDEKSRHGQRVLAVLLSLLIAAGLVVILGGVLPKAGLGFNAVMLYVIALVSVVPVIMSLLRWGFRRTPEPAEAPRPVAVPAPDAGPTSPGLSPAMKRFIAGLVPSILFLGVVGSMLVYSFDARHARGGRWELGAIVGFAAGIVLTVIVQRRLSRWAFSELLDPDRARPEAKAAVRRPGARPTAAPTVPIPWSLGWMVGPPILEVVV